MNEKESTYCVLVGRAIRRLRTEVAKKSTVLFAYENDIPKSTLTRIERGENEARIVTLKKIAESFGWSMSELFENIEKTFPEDFKIFDEEHY
ncbi:MAG: helix-turn-helix domain-containing protein [Muribaculaceae bacterium]|nr:helix-turn-helix domain-containing protein [Muribaculaceae bacterium]